MTKTKFEAMEIDIPCGPIPSMHWKAAWRDRSPLNPSILYR
jgi:hypothetical protein